MMDQLIALAEQLRSGLQDLLLSVFGPGVVQGATLEVDRYWFEWAIRNRWGWTAIQDFWESWAWKQPEDERSGWDFSLRPPDWGRHCDDLGYQAGPGEEPASPVRIRVILRETPEQPAGRPVAPRFGNLLRNYRGYPLVYEVRPAAVATGLLQQVARFFGWRGDGRETAVSVGRARPRTSGTLGGWLRCPATESLYLVSCAHVFGPAGPEVYTPGPFESRGSTPVGVVRYCEIPPRKALGQDCNLAALPGAGRLDLALALWQPAPGAERRLIPRPSVHALRRCAKMCPYQRAAFIGKESGRVEVQLNAVTLWHEVDFQDFGDGPAGPRCFGALFELSGLEGDRKDLAQPGDSGAWVFDEGGEVRFWNGMLVARQGRRAYGCYAEFIWQALTACSDFPQGPALQW
jgi:hypothetical protein